eukprot:scaffold278_cov195-Amphora_coffeaeformis.AAC.17
MNPPHFPELEPRVIQNNNKHNRGEEEEEEDVLPGFVDLRRKTWDTLYHQIDNNNNNNNNNNNTAISTKGIDKSPKGSVDEPIRSLVNLINAHPAFATLSSCSGRIAIYDANKHRQMHDDDDHVEEEYHHQQPQPQKQQEQQQQQQQHAQQHHGKGSTGGWLLAAHEAIDVEQVWKLILQQQKQSQAQAQGVSETTTTATTTTFPNGTLNFEPMLLHVAAAHVMAGRHLLQLALQCGFRESGLIITDTRVTVALRSMALGWHIPLHPSLPETYVRHVLQACNDRLQQNHDKMHRLQCAIRQGLYVERPRTLHIHCGESLQRQQDKQPCHSLPALNLWGHATVVLPSSSSFKEEILVFGGYGTGPVKSTTTSSQRSDHHLYRLTCQCCRHDEEENGNGVCTNASWEPIIATRPAEVSIANVGDESSASLRWAECTSRIHGIPVHAATWTARQGSAAVVWQSDTVVLWGGRQGPNTPLNDLLFFHKGEFWRPRAVEGSEPSPRWGHSLTSLPGSRIVLLGGRNADTTYKDVHILEMIHGRVRWTTSHNFLPKPRCFHTATPLLPSPGSILVMGGTSDATQLLSESSNSEVVLNVDQQGSIQIVESSSSGSISILGHAVVNTEGGHLIQIGGAAPAAACGEVTNDPWVRSFMWDSESRSLKQNTVTLADGWGKKMPLLVNHSAIRLAAGKDGKTKIAVVGGGVQGFAFGQMFSDSFVLELEWTYKAAVSTTKQQPSMAANQNRTATPTATTLEDTEVFYVLKRHAKIIKNKLESQELLNKQYRLSSADPKHFSNADAHVAVPVLARAFELWNSPNRPDWMEKLVQGMGRQNAMLSSSMFARHGKAKK